MAANPPPPLSQQTTDRIIASYLRSRGFKQTESILRQEARLKAPSTSDTLPSSGLEPKVQDFLLFYNEKESADPLAYEKSFGSLRKWVLDSMDFYRAELEPILYPIFIHSFLDLVTKGQRDLARGFLDMFKSDHMDMHAHDIARLSGLTDSAHIQENSLAQSYRMNRFGIVMSRYPFELLLGYLQDQGFMLILRIVNQYLNIQVGKDKPSGKKEDVTPGTLIGKDESLSSLATQFPVALGRLPEDVHFVKEVEKALSHTEQVPDGPALAQEYQKWTAVDPDAPDLALSVPLPPRKLLEIQKEIDALREVRERVELGPASLPSICCYTFHNTRDGLHSLDMSDDGTLIAGGFADSYLKVWNLASSSTAGDSKPSLPSKNTRLDMKADKQQPLPNASIKLIGHSGPVYSSSFGPDNKYLISCSEDKTARLWSMDSFKNLVVYKGHNYPIWDVDVGPFGLYFATASHDRTARLWSTDHIYSLRIFVGHLSDVDCVKFHPNSNYIVTGSQDKTCRLWDIQRGSTVRMFTGHASPVSAIAFSPDGKTMASATSSGLCLWDLDSGRKIKNMTLNHSTDIHSLEFSRDGKLIAAGCADEAVRLWDAKKTDSGEELGVYYTKKTPVYSVHFSRKNLLYALGNFVPSSS